MLYVITDDPYLFVCLFVLPMSTFTLKVTDGYKMKLSGNIDHGLRNRRSNVGDVPGHKATHYVL